MEPGNEIFAERTDLSDLHDAVGRIRQEIGKVIVGQTDMIDFLVAAVLANSHVLIEGVPGVAKTLTARLMARCLDVPFSRIQFTPDLMPSDVLGTAVFNPRDASFEFRKGPIFSNVILIDEINRAPAKTQSALFEVMEERQVTIDGQSHIMQTPFLVVATQNPVEHEGTYRLPEAQLDRFLFKINVPYPNVEEEIGILMGHHGQSNNDKMNAISPVLSGSQIAGLQQKIRSLHIEEKLVGFIANIVTTTRNHKSIYLGGSPRASIGIMTAAQAIAAMRGRDFVTPEDILYVTPAVLRHRIVLTPEREMEGLTNDQVIAQVIQGIEVPR
jgi:MoxR-like ATPase